MQLITEYIYLTSPVKPYFIWLSKPLLIHGSTTIDPSVDFLLAFRFIIWTVQPVIPNFKCTCSYFLPLDYGTEGPV